MPFSRQALVLVAAAALAACNENPGEPTAGAPTLVVIERNPGLLDVGDTVRLDARAYDADGRLVLVGAPVSWHTLDTALVRVTDAGLVTGWEGGTARVVATAGEAADTATVLVAVRPRSVTFDIVNVTAANDGHIRVGNALSLRATALDGRGRAFAIGSIAFSVADTTIASAPTVFSTSIFGSSVARRAGSTTFTAFVAGLRADRDVEVLPAAAATAEGLR